MKGILEQNNIADSEKWTLYNQVLQRYLKIMHHGREPITIPLIEREKEEDKILTQSILGSLPKSLQVKANSLLDILKLKGVTWNENGNVIHEDNTIVGSNIIDLISAIMKSSKSSVEPVGWKNFAEILYKINVPRTLVVNPKLSKYIEDKSVHQTKKEDLKEDEVKPSTFGRQQVGEKSSKLLRKEKRETISWSPYRAK